jgi:hypothetical protein
MRLPPAAMMYSATWRTSTTSECSRALTTASTACMSASIGAYRLAKFTADQDVDAQAAMLGGTVPASTELRRRYTKKRAVTSLNVHEA